MQVIQYFVYLRRHSSRHSLSFGLLRSAPVSRINKLVSDNEFVKPWRKWKGVRKDKRTGWVRKFQAWCARAASSSPSWPWWWFAFYPRRRAWNSSRPPLCAKFKQFSKGNRKSITDTHKRIHVICSTPNMPMAGAKPNAIYEQVKIKERRKIEQMLKKKKGRKGIERGKRTSTRGTIV